MFCLYCESTLPDDAVFCNNCGRRQNAVAKDITILPGPPLPGTLLNAGQPSAGNVPMVQGTPSLQSSSAIGGGATSSTEASRGAASTMHQDPSTSHAVGAESSQAVPTHNARSQGALSEGVKLTDHLSRREVISGLVGLATVAAVGGVTWWVVSLQKPPLGTTLLTYSGHSNFVISVAWSPDGKRIASAGLDNTVQIWDATHGSRILTYHIRSNGVSTVAWSPDGKHIATGETDGVQLLGTRY